MLSSKKFVGQLVFVITLIVFPIVLVVSDESTTGADSLYNCADWECGEDWLSRGRTLIRYLGKSNKHLSFQKNEDIFIIAKPKDKSASDWVGKIGDKVGLVPSTYIREDKINKVTKKILVEDILLKNQDQPPTEPLPDLGNIQRETAQLNEFSSEAPAQPATTNIDVEERQAETKASNLNPQTILEAESVSLEVSNTSEIPSLQEQSELPNFFNTLDTKIVDDVGKHELASVEAMNMRESDILPEIISGQVETKSTDSPTIPNKLPAVDEQSNQEQDTYEITENDRPRETTVDNLEPSKNSVVTSTEGLSAAQSIFTQVPVETKSPYISNANIEDHISFSAQALEDFKTESNVQHITESSITETPVSEPQDVAEKETEQQLSSMKPSNTENPTEPSYISTSEAINQSSEPKLGDDLGEREKEIHHQIFSGEPLPATEESNIPVGEPTQEAPEMEIRPAEMHSHENIDHEHDSHSHDHSHHHHHHHRHNHDFFKDSNDTSSVILVIKHLSSTLLSFLPEPLQDTILDVDDALVFTGIIALTLVSICVPYFLIEGYMSVRPLKKKVVELNKSLWKVSAAYETQQEEFEIYKQKAIAHDEFRKRADQSENDVVILKKLETKHREQITALKTQLKSQIKEAVDIRALIEKTLEDKKLVSDECGKYKAGYETVKEALKKAKEELANFQSHAKSTSLQLGVSSKNTEVLTSKIAMLLQETADTKVQLVAESEKRKLVEKEKQEVEQSKGAVEKELTEIKGICHQYEDTVSGLNEEISKLESELATIKETLGEDSPLLEVAEIQAKAAFSEKEIESLRTRLEGLAGDNENLREKLKETATAFGEARGEREQTNNRLQVLETYFKEREEEYIKTIEQLQLKESVRDKGKEELIRIIEEKENVCKDLNERLEKLKEEFEETKQQHRNEIRTLEAKGHENWLSLCQAERKAQDARKEAELLRQRLTALSKEKDDEDGDGLNGEVPMFPVIPHELVPLPLMDEPPSYFGLGDFVPPPPLPEGEEREPLRPAPLGGRLSPSFSDLDDNILSPIGVGRRDDDCTDGSSGSDSPRRSPPFRGGWVNVQHDRNGQGRESMRRLTRATSSPIQPGANL